MAYAFTVDQLGTTYAGGVRTTTYRVTETGEVLAAGTTEWSFTVKAPCTIMDFDASVVTGDGATTIQPEMGSVTEWVVDTADELAAVGVAAAHVKITDELAVRASGDGVCTIFGRSKPDSDCGSSGEIVTYITIRLGG